MKLDTSLRMFLAAAHLCAVGCFSVASAAAEVVTRDQALTALHDAQPDLRREAAVQLGTLGEMRDAEALLEALRDDEDEGVRSAAEQSVWRVWMRSGEPGVDALLARGIKSMSEGLMGQAVESFTRVIELRPDFAEGWNKRATAYYLMGDYEHSLKDCDEVIERNPHHFGALSGYGLIYVRLGNLERALEYFESAFAINPNMEGVAQSIELIRYQLGKSGKQSI